MNHLSVKTSSKYVQNRNLQYRIKSSLLVLFSTPFIVWQMGVLYFSGTTMSLFGRTPIPLTQESTTLVIAAGYLVSMLLIGFFPRKTIYMERVVLPLALIATVLMLFPFPPALVTVLFFTSAFFCVFSIGTMCSLAAQHFTVETTWRDGIISMTLGGVLIAILQNDFVQVSFSVFTVLSILLIAAQTAFYFIIPAKIQVPYVSRDNKIRMPKIIFIGIWLISGFSTLLICLASSFAESVFGGVSTLYLSAALMAVILFFLRRKFGSESIRIFGGFFALSTFGFMLSFLSLYIPALRMIACVLLGFVVVLANLWIFFAAASFRVYPTRFIGVIGAGVGLVLAAFHSGLLDALRDNLTLLYGLYAALSVALLLIYYFMEPYFLHMWNKAREAKPAQASLQPLEENLVTVQDAAHSVTIKDAAHSFTVMDAAHSVTIEDATHPVTVKDAAHPFDVLSEQERILAELILDGHTETSAAKHMNISVNTQKGYRKNIYFKLDIHSKRELFELANK